MKRYLLFLLSLSFSISTIHAGESIIVGQDSNRRFFQFTYSILSHAEVPRTEGEIVSGSTLNHHDLTVTDELGNGSELILAPCATESESWDIVCTPTAPFGLANARYRHDERIGAEGGFRCVSNCSNQIPDTLEFLAIDSGC